MDELFSKRLSELITNSDFTLDKIEEYVGKTNATISRYASGEITGVKRSTIVKLADFFNVSPAWLAGFSDDKYEGAHIPFNNKINNEITQKYGITSIELLENYSKLNKLGKQKANENVKDLTKISDYVDKKINIQNA